MYSQTVGTKLSQIAELAARNKSMVFTTLFHRIDEEWLRDAYGLVRKDGATGIDQVSGEEYSENLTGNLKYLHQRLKEKRYRAPMIRRVRIPKDDGKKRALGITTFEDKIAQRSVCMAMEAVYEQDFLPCSYGFRPKRSQHQALQAIRQQCIEMEVQWILDADIKAYFDTIPRKMLLEIVRKRINDGNIIRLLGKWLNTGVVDLKQIVYPETGTPQGGVISPLLANIYLHEVLDVWFTNEVKPRLKGKAFLVRFADDFIIGFEKEEDARKVYEVLPKRFDKYGLQIHPEKTRLRRFAKPKRDDHDSETFDFLGFTHYWAKSHKGFWVLKRKTSSKKKRQKLKELWQWCKENRHEPITKQYRTLCRKLSGLYQYYAIRCNGPCLSTFRYATQKFWKYWMSRRSRKSAINWTDWNQLMLRFPLPQPRILHNTV